LLKEKRKTVGRSFRIDEEWIRVLNEEAEKQGISVNSLLNRLLQQYSFLRYMLRYGAITLTRKGFYAILESCPEDNIRENARNAGSTIARDLLLTMGAQPNYKFLVSLYKKLFSEFAGWFECDHHIRRDKEFFHLRHDLGIKWSIYLAEAASEMFKSVLNKEVTTEISNSSVTITINRQN
jgi:hypothetical protein